MNNRLLLLIFLFLCTLVLFSPSVFSDDVEKTSLGNVYACAGVGDSKEDPKWKAYPLKLMFTAAGRAYVADVSVSITDPAGNEVLRVVCDAPWLLAKLKPGTYGVSAQAYGSTVKRTKVTVPASGQNELAIRFPEVPGGTGTD